MESDCCPVISADYKQATNATNRTAKAALIAPLYMFLVAGTGGVYTSANIQTAWINPQNSVVTVRGDRAKRKIVLSFSEQLLQIRDMFGLSMTELAQVFAVSRPTVYSWTNGVDPKDQGVKDLINKLSCHVETLRAAGLTSVNVLARQPVSDGKSVIDLLKSGTDVTSAIASIKFTGASLPSSSRIKRNFGPASKTRRVSVEVISAPIFITHGDEA